MTLFHISGIEIRLNLLTLPVIFAFIALDMTSMLLISITALCLHELCHVITARRLCISIQRIELQPCGFSAAVNEDIMSLSTEFAVAVSGVLFSIISGSVALASMALTGFNSDMLNRFALSSIAIGMFNLMPVLPLDGGRMFRAALNKLINARKAHAICIVTGIIISLSVISIGIYGIYANFLNFSVAVIGVLMLMGSFSSIKHNRSFQAKSMLKRANALACGETLPVCSYALNESTDINSAISILNMNKYNIIHVIDSEMNIISTLTENDLMYSAMSGCTSLRDAVRKIKGHK